MESLFKPAVEKSFSHLGMLRDNFVREVVKIIREEVKIVREVVKNVRENIPTWRNDLVIRQGFFTADIPGFYPDCTKLTTSG